MDNMVSAPLWVRSKDGWIAGVCAGLAKHFGIKPWIMRVIWIVSIFLFVPILFYFVLAFSLPREDQIEFANRPKILGVCLKLAKKVDAEVGLVRTLALSSLLISCGLTTVIYFVAHLILLSEEKKEI